MMVWGGVLTDGVTRTSTGGLYDPATDRWTATSNENAPSPRVLHTAVWTGNLVVVWGGMDDGSFLNTGGRYDPLTNLWAPTSIASAPSRRRYHTAVSTGREMIVWGGIDGIDCSGCETNTGGRYDPVGDTWWPTPTLNAPPATSQHTAVWIGHIMIVWGGTSLNTGGRYFPPDPAGEDRGF